MGANIQDVANKAGVSVTTVSRIMNNRGSISDKTRQKVQNAMQELNYFPNQLAINLFKKRTQLVGLIVPDVSHSFFATEIKYIERSLHIKDYKLILCNPEDDNNREKEYLDMLQCNKVDGIIIASHTLDLEDYEKVMLPIVALDRYLGKHIPVISSDHEQGGRLAALELIQNGCKKVIQIKGYSAVPTPSNERNSTFKKTMDEYGICCKTYELPLNSFSFHGYIDYVTHILFSDREIDGVFAVDNVACAVSKVAGNLDIHIPNQLKIVGYDGTDLALIPNKALTTIRQDISKLATATVDLLLSLIEGEVSYESNTHIKIPVSLEKNETTL